MNQPECPKCGENHYIHFAGCTQENEGVFVCDICDISWLIPSSDGQRYPSISEDDRDRAWLEWHFSQRR